MPRMPNLHRGQAIPVLSENIGISPSTGYCGISRLKYVYKWAQKIMDENEEEMPSRTKVSFTTPERAKVKRAAESVGMTVAGYVRDITLRRTATLLTALRRTELAIFADQTAILADLVRILSSVDLTPETEMEIIACLARLEATMQIDGENP